MQVPITGFDLVPAVGQDLDAHHLNPTIQEGGVSPILQMNILRLER